MRHRKKGHLVRIGLKVGSRRLGSLKRFKSKEALSRASIVLAGKLTFLKKKQVCESACAASVSMLDELRMTTTLAGGD